MALTHLKLGTRGSKLALIQTQLVADALVAARPGLTVETVIIKTEGDRNLSAIPLDTVGKSWFTAEIDHALITSHIDLAVHSLKDLPLELSAELALHIVLERDDPRDGIITKSGASLSELPAGSIVGTDSVRRAALIRHLWPDLTVQSLRGNVQTRLRKLKEDNYDAIVLAVAGLNRLGQINKFTEILDATNFIPAVGQGTLGVEVRSGDTHLRDLLGQLEHEPTVTAARAERTFSETIGGGCKLPIAAYARLEADTIHLYGLLAELDGAEIMFQTTSGPVAQAEHLARALATNMLEHCSFNFKPDTTSQNATR